MTSSSDNDRRLAQLMRSAQDGDSAAYERLLRELAALVHHVVRQAGFREHQDAEDLVQDILLSLHAARATYDPDRPFLPWLMAIARHRIVDAIRRTARRSAREVALDRVPETSLEDRANTSVDSELDPDLVVRAMRALPDGQREALELVKLRGMSLKEAAAVTGRSAGSLKVAVHRALMTLRALLTREVRR